MTLVHSGTQQDTKSSPENRLILRADRGLLERLKLEKIGKPLAMGPVIVSKSRSVIRADLRQTPVLARMNFKLTRL
jgi:hypothetical protein